MKKGSIINEILVILLFILLLVLLSVASLYMYERFLHLTHFSDALNEVNNSRNTMSEGLLDQVSVFIAICTGGITLFGIFGGILSYINVKNNKKLEKKIRQAKRALKTQKELTIWRLIQDARYYRSLRKYNYADSYFQKAIGKSSNFSYTYYVAQYERWALRGDLISKELTQDLNASQNLKYLDNILDEIKALCKDIKKKRGNCRRNLLLQEVYFLLGNIYGSYAIINKKHNLNMEFKKNIAYSIKYFKKAIYLDHKNVDFLRNASLSYALANDASNCLKLLDKAKERAEEEILYKNLMYPERLTKLFEPYKTFMSNDIMFRLKTDFGITLCY